VLEPLIHLAEQSGRQTAELPKQNPPLNGGEFVALYYGHPLQAGASPFGDSWINDHIGGEDLRWHNGGDEGENHIVSLAIGPGNDNGRANLRTL